MILLIYRDLTTKNSYSFMYQMSQALLAAFSTASSAATLPVTMQSAIENAGVSMRSAESCSRWGPRSTWIVPPSTGQSL